MEVDESSIDTSQRPKKRLRKATNEFGDKPESSGSSTRLFAPFRALGLITNHIPFVLQTRSYKGASDGPRVHILTCLGKSWALWEGGKMTLLFVGAEAEESIQALAMDGDSVWAASGSSVICYHRGKEVKRAVNPLGTHLSTILVFGSHLLALTNDGRRLLAWSTSSCDLVSTIEFPLTFTATSLLHPSTYINKILIGSSQGSLQLWNISTKSLIHEFPNTTVSDSSAPSSPITAMVQSPAIDVVAVGFASGEIVLHDIRVDERLMRMFQEGGIVRSLSFRGDGQGVLASASSSGHITLWDLSERGRLLHVIRGAHDAAVTGLEWIPGQPVLVSSGEDNAVKQWLFESPTSVPQLLKFRAGHFSPPHLIRYYGSDGKALLTASRDRSLRYTSVVRDSRSTEMSQGHLAKKATSLSIPIAALKHAPVSSLSFSSTRSKDWDDVLTSHSEETFARTWSVPNKRHGKYKMAVHSETNAKKNTSQLQGVVKAVHVTACGNFGLAANSKGVIGMWNMQSGIRRKTFELPGSKAGKRDSAVVVGLATDPLNRTVIAGTQDGQIHFYDFHTAKLQASIKLPSTIASILLQRDSGLLAVTCDDLTIRIIDIETHNLARELTGFEGRILDIDFSNDSRWLIACSMDSVVRTFDIPTGRMIDAFRTANVATSLSFSPTGDFLATAHVDSVGVYLWANRSQYAEVSLRGVPHPSATLEPIELPGVEGTVEDEDLLPDLASLTVQESQDVFSSPDQLEDGLVTLTLLPRERWQSLINLDIIQARNKPKEPPKAPEKAPFFLPTLPGVEHRFDLTKVPANAEPDISANGKKKLSKSMSSIRSELQLKMDAESDDSNCDDLFDYIKKLSPPAIDLEIHSLTLLDDLSRFMQVMRQRLRSHRDFEAVQSLLSVFLRIHGETIIQNEELVDSATSLIESQREESRDILELLTSSLGTLNVVRDIG